MKRFFAELLFEILAWVMLICWGFSILYSKIKRSLLDIWRRKELIKQTIKKSAMDEIAENTTPIMK